MKGINIEEVIRRIPNHKDLSDNDFGFLTNTMKAYNNNSGFTESFSFQQFLFTYLKFEFSISVREVKKIDVIVVRKLLETKGFNLGICNSYKATREILRGRINELTYKSIKNLYSDPTYETNSILGLACRKYDPRGLYIDPPSYICIPLSKLRNLPTNLTNIEIAISHLLNTETI